MQLLCGRRPLHPTVPAPLVCLEVSSCNSIFHGGSFWYHSMSNFWRFSHEPHPLLSCWKYLISYVKPLSAVKSRVGSASCVDILPPSRPPNPERSLFSFTQHPRGGRSKAEKTVLSPLICDSPVPNVCSPQPGQQERQGVEHAFVPDVAHIPSRHSSSTKCAPR